MFSFLRSISLSLAIALSCSINAFGQELIEFNLNHATNIAISVHPEIRKLGWQMEKAISDGFQQSRLVNPQIGPLANEIGNEGQGGQYGFFLQRNLVRNQRVQQIQSAAEWEARSYNSQSEMVQRKIALETARLFVEIEFLNRKVQLADKKLEELTRIQKIVENLMKGGEVAPLELTRLEIEISQEKQSVNQLQLRVSQNIDWLRLHLNTEEPVVLDFDFDQEVELVLKSSHERHVELDDHPIIRQISDRIEAQKWRFQVANSRQLPDWQLQTSVNFDTASDDFFGGFQLNIPWMVNDRKTGLIDSAAASVQILNESRNQAKRQLQRKLISLAGKRKSLVSEILSIETEVIPKVDQVSKQTAALFHAGEADHKSVKEAVMMGYQWRERKLDLARELLLTEVETETLILD